MSRDLEFTPVPAPVKKVERTVRLEILCAYGTDYVIRAQREIAYLAADGSLVSSEPSLTVERRLSEIQGDAAALALVSGVSAKLDEWAVADQTPPPAEVPTPDPGA